MPEEWEQFAIEAPFSGEAEDCQPLEYVDHVSHIHSSLEILRDRHLRPRLVADKSKLNSTRILVNWVSPFPWATGYRYGHICFRFKWATLIAGMEPYWVEKIPMPILLRVSFSQGRTTTMILLCESTIPSRITAPGASTQRAASTTGIPSVRWNFSSKNRLPFLTCIGRCS